MVRSVRAVSTSSVAAKSSKLTAPLSLLSRSAMIAATSASSSLIPIRCSAISSSLAPISALAPR